VHFDVEATGIAEHLAVRGPAPQGCLASPAIHAAVGGGLTLARFFRWMVIVLFIFRWAGGLGARAGAGGV